MKRYIKSEVLPTKKANLWAIGGIFAAIGAFLWFNKKPIPIPPPPNMANLYGQITDRVTGKALVGASISLDSQTKASAADGSYLFANLQLGMYSIIASLTGYETLTGSVTVVEGNNTLNIQLVPIFVPGELANLTGYITASTNGAPISGALVRIAGVSRTSRDDGFYGVPSMPSGTYEIIFSKEMYVTLTQTVTLVAGDNHVNVSLTLAPIGQGIHFQVILRNWEVLYDWGYNNEPISIWTCVYGVGADAGAGQQAVGWTGPVTNPAQISFLFDPKYLGGQPPTSSGMQINMYSTSRWYQWRAYPTRVLYTGMWWPENGAIYEVNAAHEWPDPVETPIVPIRIN